jgi:signal transduction histidine kinase
MRISTSLAARISGNILLRYALALAVVLTALLVCRGLNFFVTNRAVYVLLFPAISFSAWYCGVGPSVLAIGVTLVGAAYQFMPEVHSFRPPATEELVGIVTFALSCVVIVVMGESRRRQNEALLNAQGELEKKVRERTADLDALNRNLRELSARLLHLQDEERRRIARELHDSVGQMLVALTMNLSAVRDDVERLTKTAAALNDSENLVREMSSEVRTISHLLHPPLLDEAGLSSALQWYVDGFARRSGIKVELDLPDDLGRLSSELETAIFRVVQECLTNIHRHSASPVAKIQLRRRDHQLLVEVEDEGKGIPPEKQEKMASAGAPGVGIRGMRERIRQLGGTLEIHSNGAGTTVTGWLPVGGMTGADASAAAVADRSSPAAA